MPAAAVRALGLIYLVAQHPDATSASYRENGEGKFLTTGVIQWLFIAGYIGGQAEVLAHPDYAVLQSGLEALPATWVGTMGHDPLRDEGHALAQRHPRLHPLHGGVARRFGGHDRSGAVAA